MDKLHELQKKHSILVDVRGKGLFVGLELVKDRESKTPVDETVTMRIAAECLNQGVMIGRTNRSFSLYNNTIALSPAMICGRSEVDEIISAIDKAIEVTTT